MAIAIAVNPLNARFCIWDRLSSLVAASSQTWASYSKDPRTSSARASRAHLKHSLAITWYSAAVFMRRRAPPARLAAS